MIKGKPRRKTKAAPKPKSIVADTIQQLIGEEFVYLPVLYVDGNLTSIQGEKAIPSQNNARRIAAHHAKILRGQ